MLADWLENWGDAVDYIWGDDERPYPRWLRRLYIVTWPIAAPLRLIVGMVILFGGLLIICVFGALYSIWDKLRDWKWSLTHHLRRQWNWEDNQ